MQPPSVTGLSFAMPSHVVSPRMPSSCISVTSRISVSPVSLFVSDFIVVSGTTSASSRPAASAAATRCKLRAPYSSCASRGMP